MKAVQKRLTLIASAAAASALAAAAWLLISGIDTRSEARRTKLAQDLLVLEQAFDQYVERQNSLPVSLGDLFTADGRKTTPRDPWAREYLYEPASVGGSLRVRLVSLGEDGTRGGDGDSTDVTADFSYECRERCRKK